MRRRPNPWIAVPSLLLGLLAGTLGYAVTDVSCRQPDITGITSSCVGWSIVVAIASFLLVTVGVGLVLVLVFRCLAEWRESQ